MPDNDYYLIANPHLPRDPTFLQTAAWEEMQGKLLEVDPDCNSWRENKVRNALTGYTIHIATIPGGPAEKIARDINQYVSRSLREGDQPFQERITTLTKEALDNSWSSFIRKEFTEWLPEIDGMDLPEGETLESIAAFDDGADKAIRTLFDEKFRATCAPDDDDFIYILRKEASSCSESEMGSLRDEIKAACLRVCPQDTPSP